MSAGNNWKSDYTVQSAEYLEGKIGLLTRLENIAEAPTLSRRDAILRLLEDLRGEKTAEPAKSTPCLTDSLREGGKGGNY